MRAPGTLQLVSAHLRRRAPAFRSAQYDHRPMGALRRSGFPGFLLVFPDLADTMLYGRRHRLMHRVGIRSFHEVGCPAVTPEQVLQFLARNTSEQRGVIDLVSVEVKNR